MVGELTDDGEMYLGEEGLHEDGSDGLGEGTYSFSATGKGARGCQQACSCVWGRVAEEGHSGKPGFSGPKTGPRSPREAF